MNKFPDNWIKTTLSEIAHINMGQSPDGKYTNYESNGLPLVGGAADFQGNVIDASRYTSRPTKVSKVGDLIICIRATIGKVAFSDQIYCLGRGVAGITPYVDAKWLFYKLLESANDLDEAGTGTTFKQIDKKTLENWPIILPPLAEQKRISEKIDSLMFRIEQLDVFLSHILGMLEKYKASILSSAFKGDLTAQWRKNKNQNDPKSVFLKSAVLGLTYGTSSKSYPSGKVPVLRMGNIQDGKLNWDKLAYTSDVKEIEKYYLTPGDVLFNRTNSPELVGKSALYDGENEAIFAGYLIRIKCSENLLPSYLTFCLNSPEGKAYCQKVKVDGINQSNINAKKLAEFELPLPSIAEQEEIVRLVNQSIASIDYLRQLTIEAISLMPRLNQSILTKAFCGELIEPDVNDKSALLQLKDIQKQKKSSKTIIPKTAQEFFSSETFMNKKLIDVLSENSDWVDAQEAFRLCGITKTSNTEEIEGVYADLRLLDLQGLLLIDPVRDTDGNKIYDRIKLKKQDNHAS
ncbi:hypothetical protein BWI96_10320 [Siphonobacter sp. SORGH_AS_0500]|uniref:restriction endonuclease subunit S n=1 Tax=Siphonobacter sp. SORGH_AS_0500 TaxID=1864824 RepID=UPI000CBFDCB4|nr:restriction endonuclease subunit S [Siphonobacter sp. SORGH_AS_0500]PKK36760.1 hypothetical protein BWI96_10320 [Siphonobacter sp. SORGH_AS_0500]